ncbi:GntR family transcriptional regulator, partial [Pseudomonas sp. YuFO8]|nr:GntR family transcriptional regulator [Pseudomonas sp. YuFO8]
MGRGLPPAANSFTTSRSVDWNLEFSMNSIAQAVPEAALQAIRKLIKE